MGDGPSFGGLIRSTDLVDRDGPPTYHGDQRRLVEHPESKMTYWVTITAAERARIIDHVPKGWHHVVKAREGGATIEALAAKYRMETEKMRDYLAMAYGWVEQQVHLLAERKIGLHPK